VKRPQLTARQRQYQREQRALLALRRAAVRFTDSIDTDGTDVMTQVDLEGAAMKYANTLGTRDRKRLVR